MVGFVEVQIDLVLLVVVSVIDRIKDVIKPAYFIDLRIKRFKELI